MYKDKREWADPYTNSHVQRRLGWFSSVSKEVMTSKHGWLSSRLGLAPSSRDRAAGEVGPHTHCVTQNVSSKVLKSWSLRKQQGRRRGDSANPKCKVWDIHTAQLWTGSPWRLSWGRGRGHLRFKRLQRVPIVLWGGVLPFHCSLEQRGTSPATPSLDSSYSICPLTSSMASFSFHSTPACPAPTSFSCRVSFPWERTESLLAHRVIQYTS